MILDLILDAVGAMLEYTVTDWRPTPRQRVKRALRMARTRKLIGRRRKYALIWLTFGLANLAELRLQSREQDITDALRSITQAGR